MNLRLSFTVALFFSTSSAWACENNQSSVLALSWSGGAEENCLPSNKVENKSPPPEDCENPVSLLRGGFRCKSEKPPQELSSECENPVVLIGGESICPSEKVTVQPCKGNEVFSALQGKHCLG